MPLPITRPDLYREMGLSEEEFHAIRKGLGREPTLTELGMFAVLWSEHCSYKSSQEVLRYFARYQEASEQERLENAGVVPITPTLGVAFKVESHNHPSAVEPYQGAATGVGGIIRDVLAMGARPIACLDSLRFGDIQGEKNAHNRRLFQRVVEGIGGYGNCIGVPTVAGEVSFHARYEGCPLVNVMCIGIVPLNEVMTSAGEGLGNSVMYLGTPTGRDGIHGATFASEVLQADGEDKRPNVQIADPFAGKLLIEATLEALKTGAIVALQDMGAAGLTCTTCEMSARGGVGMEINLDLVPLRDETMNAYEIMLSESQERMLAIVKKGEEQKVISVFQKWGLHAVVIGTVTSDGIVTVFHKGEVEAAVPAKLITHGCPTPLLQAKEPEHLKTLRAFSPNSLPEPPDYAKVLLTLLASPTLASKRWVYEQYDYSVQTRTSLPPGSADAAVLTLHASEAAPHAPSQESVIRPAIAAKIDGNGAYVYADPFVGGQLALVESARNVACTGARPLAATDCLNFGNPNDPEVFWTFKEAVRGIASASEALGIPIVSGNVSFYNEGPLGPVLPTPTIGVVGVLEDARKRLPSAPPQGMGFLYLVYGYDEPPIHEGLGASEYLRIIHGLSEGCPQPPNLTSERNLIDFLVECAQRELLTCAHDWSEGGLAVALAEMSAIGSVGCFALLDAEEHFQRHILGPVLEQMMRSKVSPAESVWRSIIDAANQNNPWTYSQRVDARLFGEMPGRVVIGVSAQTVKEKRLEELYDLTYRHGLFLHPLGTYDSTNPYFQIASPSRSLLRVEVKVLQDAYFQALERIMSSPTGG
jgi:phosphoribosylformylglycinamidine synthase